jgi:hypothetical protein
VLLAHFLTVATVADFAGLRLSVLLAHAVFANQVWCTTIDGVAKVTLAPESAVALLQNVGVQRYGCETSEIGVWWRRQVFCPVEIAACGVRASENVFESFP